MAITTTKSVSHPAAFSIGDGLKAQLMTYRALSGATDGTVTADELKTVVAVLLDGQIKMTSAESYLGNVATLAFAVPAETAASRTLQSALTFTAVADLGQDGNSITITFVEDGELSPGQEIVSVSGTAITITVPTSAASTATDVKTAYDLSAEANALATVAVVGGHETDGISGATALALQNGVTGGARGSLICLGRP